jgi:group I intron endonuclease
MDSEYYVYALLDSSKPGEYKFDDYLFKYEPFYIGKGKKKRIKETIYDKSQFKSNKIKKMKISGIDIISIKILENLTNKEAIKNEIYFINLIGRRDMRKGTLVNTTDGGEGRINSKHSEITKYNISKNRKGKTVGWKHNKKTLIYMSENQSGEKNGFYGKEHLDKTKTEQSIRVGGLSHPMYGKKHDKDTIRLLKKHRSERISNSLIRESCQKFNKPVLMFDLNLNFIREFESVKEASLLTEINKSIISKCCRGDIKSPTRFYFRYKNEEDIIKNNKFLIEIGDYFTLDYKKYRLVKRNKKTCICELDGDLKTLNYSDFRFLEQKDTSNIDIVELYLYLKSIDCDFKLDGNIIYNKKIKVNYLKIENNSDLFIRKMENTSDIVIFSDEWINKKEIVKSRLKYFIGNSEKIWARKCEVREVTNNTLVRDFLEKNHIQGFVGSRVKLGLFYNDELVSIMTFGNLRKSMGQNVEVGSYELLRFCNKLNYSIVGGASKLFNYFVENYKPKSILSYADKRWSSGDLYKKIGFKLLSDTPPNYYWIVNGRREYRFKWRKDILVSKGYDANKTEVQIMNSLNCFRIFDRGSHKFIKEFN